MLAKPEISPLRGYATPVEMTGVSRSGDESVEMTGVSASDRGSIEMTGYFFTWVTSPWRCQIPGFPLFH